MSGTDKMQQQKEKFVELLEKSYPAISALGDETRLLIVKALIEHRDGLRVGEIQEYTHISRTAVSHHLKILKSAGIITLRKEGTKNFYYIDSSCSTIHIVAEFWREAERIIALYPRNGGG